MSMFGYYSALAMDQYRNGKIVLKPCLYRTPTGEEVAITSLGSTRNPADSGYYWSDAKCVGEIVDCVGPLPDSSTALSWETFMGDVEVKLGQIDEPSE